MLRLCVQRTAVYTNCRQYAQSIVVLNSEKWEKAVVEAALGVRATACGIECSIFWMPVDWENGLTINTAVQSV